MTSLDLDYGPIIIPIAIAIFVRAVGEYALLTRTHPLIVALAKAANAAALPFAVAFYIVLITAQIQM